VIGNPELIAQLHEAEAEKPVADAELAHQCRHACRNHRPAQSRDRPRHRRPSPGATDSYNRTKQLAADKLGPQSKLDQDTDALTLA
jgi:hypothetical protein